MRAKLRFVWSALVAPAVALALAAVGGAAHAASFDPPRMACQWVNYPTLQYPYQGVCNGTLFIYDGVSTWPTGYYTVTSIPYGADNGGGNTGGGDPNPFPCRLYEPCSGGSQPRCAWRTDVATGRLVYVCG